jgi:hypothetical protein
MSTTAVADLAGLYLEDETAWLDRMAELARSRQADEIDWANLAEYLAEMAGRDRREVESRLAVLLAHILKWTYQPDRRSNGWRATIIEQRHELVRHASRGVLRRHAEEVLGDAYREAVERAAAETGIAENAVPAECSYSLPQLLEFDPAGDDE